MDATRNVPFLDNHDMSRFYSVIGEDFGKFKMGIAWLLTLRGTPQLYYGTEVLMKNFSQPRRQGARGFPRRLAGRQGELLHRAAAARPARRSTT